MFSRNRSAESQMKAGGRSGLFSRVASLESYVRMSRSGVGAGLPALVRVIKLVIRLKTYLFDFRFTFVNGQWTMRDERSKRPFFHQRSPESCAERVI